MSKIAYAALLLSCLCAPATASNGKFVFTVTIHIKSNVSEPISCGVSIGHGGDVQFS